MLEIRRQRATYEINHGSLIKCAKNELRNLVVPCFPNARANRQAKLKTKPTKRHKAIVLYGNIVTVTLHGHTPVPEPLKEEHDYYTQDDWTPDKAFGHVFAASHQTCKSKENTKDTCKGVGSHAERLIQPTKVSQVPMLQRLHRNPTRGLPYGIDKNLSKHGGNINHKNRAPLPPCRRIK